MWLVHKAVGSKVFRETLKHPEVFSWVWEQINKDRDDVHKIIADVFEALKPWLNSDLFSVIEKKKQREETKIQRLAKTEAKNVQVTNLYDVMMRNMGLDPKKIKEK